MYWSNETINIANASSASVAVGRLRLGPARADVASVRVIAVLL
jgi:hypothetical protein